MSYASVGGIRFLIENSSNINHIDVNLKTPLFHSCYTNTEKSNEVAKLLIAAGADINLNSGGNHTNRSVSPLMLCCQRGNVVILELLLQCKANLTVSVENNNSFHDEYNFNAFLTCCKYLQMDCLKLLLKYRDESTEENGSGIDINSSDKWGFTGLMYTSEVSDMMKILLYANADTSLTDNEGSTVLISCCKRNKCESLITLLNYKAESINDGAGIDINAIDNDGKTGLMYACENRYTDIIEILSAFRADTSIIDKKGNSVYTLNYSQRIKELINAVVINDYVLK
jgi:ankyrin repeat protein